MKQNGVVWLPGPALLLFTFRFEYYFDFGPEKLTGLSRNGPQVWWVECN